MQVCGWACARHTISFMRARRQSASSTWHSTTAAPSKKKAVNFFATRTHAWRRWKINDFNHARVVDLRAKKSKTNSDKSGGGDKSHNCNHKSAARAFDSRSFIGFCFATNLQSLSLSSLSGGDQLPFDKRCRPMRYLIRTLPPPCLRSAAAVLMAEVFSLAASLPTWSQNWFLKCRNARERTAHREAKTKRRLGVLWNWNEWSLPANIH